MTKLTMLWKLNDIEKAENIWELAVLLTMLLERILIIEHPACHVVIFFHLCISKENAFKYEGYMK